jgi:hypothetical protein
MADVTSTFAAKDVGFAAVMQRLQSRLSGFNRQMNTVAASSKKIQSSFSGLTRNVLGLAAAYVGVSQAMSAFNSALELGGKLSDLSSVTGESAGELAILQRAFDNADVGGEKMLPMLSRMTEFIKTLGEQSPRAVSAAKMLGVSFEQLKSQMPIQQFQTLIKAIAALRNENERLEASGDIFGTRMGGKLIVLANNFATEMSTAREQLGSVVDILDRSANRIDDLGDTLKNSLGSKFRDFALGVLDGARGANELVTSLSKIDTAAAGIKLGQLFSGAVEKPHLAFLLMGETLLLAVKKAGNELINATSYAAAVWTKALTNRLTFSTLMDGLLAGFQQIFNFAGSISLKIVKELIKGVAGLASLIPVVGPAVARDIASPVKTIEEQEGRFEAQAAELRQRMTSSLFGTAEDLVDAARNLPRKDFELFDTTDQQAQVDALTAAMKPTPPPLTIARQDQAAADKFFRELNEAYRKNVDQIYELTTDRNEQLRRLEVLRGQYKERAYEAISRVGYPSEELMTPSAQMRDNTRADAEREAMKESAAASNKPDGGASEPTLQKAVTLLESLNEKFPTAVLV